MAGLLEETHDRLAVLDLQPGASWAQVKDRYRFLAKVWHPDRFGADPRARSRAEKQFKRVNEAYQWLLKHQGFVESHAEEGKTPGPEPDAGPGADAHSEPPGADQRGQPRQPRTDEGKAPKQPIDETAVERFLWGVIATFTLIALAVFVLSGSLSRLLRQVDSEGPVADSAVTNVAAGADDARTARVPSHELRYVTASRLFVRAEPHGEAAVVSVLERGDRVRLRPESGEWLAVVGEDGTSSGWVHGDYVSPVSRAQAATRASASPSPPRSSQDMEADFSAMARAEERAETGTPDAELPPAGEMELIRGAWKPKNPDPAAQRRDLAQSSRTDSDLERWTGAVEGAAPPDLPRVTVRLFEDVETGQPVGTAVYWFPTGACTYALEVLQEEGDWIRTVQRTESPQCPGQGEIWFMVRGSDMTAIWHRLDGRRWFTSHLSTN